MQSLYAETRRSRAKPVRVVIQVPKEEVEAVDQWAASAGMPNRTVAIRHLLKLSLERLTREN